jgi:hypothetical protein
MGKRIYDANEWPDFKTALVERMKIMQTPIILNTINN